MPRKGSQLERWAEESIRGTPTVNSGATFEDADMKVDGVGGRLYEFKSSVVHHGISIRKDHVMILLQRAFKLGREPVFVYQNADGFKVALMPFKVLSNAIERWEATGFDKLEVSAIRHAVSTAPSIKTKGNNIHIPAEDLKNAMDLNGLMIYHCKSTIPWVVIEVDTWLEIAGDKKGKNNV